ncbi:MAG: radical SAM protein [Deltaproteobacteria bacterium]|nr:radical SAM protein [Deltaproteobacteria bacterium]
MRAQKKIKDKPVRSPKSSRLRNASESLLTAVVAGASGEIFELEGYAAVGMDGQRMATLAADQALHLPYGSELMFLPDRMPILHNLSTGKLEVLRENPYQPGSPLFPVAAFNSPGYVVTHNCAYQEGPDARMLPLFSYGAVGWHRGQFCSAVVLVDSEPRQDLRFMKTEDVMKGIRALRKQIPSNRLRAHLEHCAMTYGCPAGKNFFLGRYEAPLPTAQSCNARCLGCLSLQQEGVVSNSQERIAFTPTPDEIAEIALFHIHRVKHAVVSFGQGCEGDPLMAADVIAPAIRLIRSKTLEGTININTNAGRPEILSQLLDAGMDSMRVSMNSVRSSCYEAYFRPKGYGFEDVEASIDHAIGRGRHVAINYLNCPGFTDTPEEVEALLGFLSRHPLHFIQWRNLNFDPFRYLKEMHAAATHSRPIGMKTVLERIQERFPGISHGYFNPPKERFYHQRIT